MESLNTMAAHEYFMKAWHSENDARAQQSAAAMENMRNFIARAPRTLSQLANQEVGSGVVTAVVAQYSLLDTR